MKTKNLQITEWDSPNAFMITTIDGQKSVSAYGPISYQNWCEKEMARINKNGNKVEIVTRKDGQIALTKI